MSCPDCFKGSVHTHGTPVGKWENLYGYKTYVAGTPDSTTSKSTIFYIPDAFGVKLLNNQLLADRYAKETGCRVIIPDIIPDGGVSVSLIDAMDTVMRPAGYNPFAWLSRGWALVTALYHFIPFMIRSGPAKIYPEVLKYARAARADLPAGGKLGVCGFCWGGYGSTNLCVETATEGGSQKLVDAQFCAHPSALKAPGMVVDAIVKGKVPYSCGVAEKDIQFDVTKAREVEAILREKVGRPEDNDYEFVIHKDCMHGFAVRANPDHKIEFQGLEDAAVQAVKWFNKYLN